MEVPVAQAAEGHLLARPLRVQIIFDHCRLEHRLELQALGRLFWPADLDERIALAKPAPFWAAVSDWPATMLLS